MIIEIVVKCYKSYTDLERLARSLDATLQQQGYEVYEICTTIITDDDDANEDSN